MIKLLIAAIVGGALMFGWGGLAHMLLPLGHMGMSAMPVNADDAIVAQMKASLHEPGMYYFPAMADWQNATDEQKAAWEARATSGPQGMLIYAPIGEGMSTFNSHLVMEGLFDVICALIMGVVLLHVPASVGYLRRVGVATLLGLYGALDIDASYHNWYGFPSDYFHAQVIMAAVGALVAGLAVAAICKQQQT